MRFGTVLSLLLIGLGIVLNLSAIRPFTHLLGYSLIGVGVVGLLIDRFGVKK